MCERQVIPSLPVRTCPIGAVCDSMPFHWSVKVPDLAMLAPHAVLAHTVHFYRLCGEHRSIKVDKGVVGDGNFHGWQALTNIFSGLVIVNGLSSLTRHGPVIMTAVNVRSRKATQPGDEK